MMLLTAAAEVATDGPEARRNCILDTDTGVVYQMTRAYGEGSKEKVGNGYPALAFYGPGATNHRVPYCILYGPTASSLWAVLSTLAEPVI